jgi:pyruvate,orthophosphate dikinase
VLNIGINDYTVNSFSSLCKNRWFALDLQKTFLQQFGTFVLGVEPKLYEDILWKSMKQHNVPSIRDIPVEGLEQVVLEFKGVADVPSDPYIQLEWAVEALFRSWHSERYV